MSRRDRRIIGRGRIFVATVVGMMALLAAASGNAATTITVTTASDSCTNCGSLRDAINTANSDTGDTIVFNIPGTGPFTITLIPGPLPDITSSMTIAGGTTQATGVTIDIHQNPQAFFVNNSATLYLSNLTFKNGNNPGAGKGGAINIGSATVNVTNCAFMNNNAEEGGAVYVTVGLSTLNLTNSTFSGNSAGFGGAIFSVGTVNVANCAFLDNNGDAIFQQFHTLNVTNSTFSGNSTGGGAGAITLLNGATLNVTNSTFSGNTSLPGFGGDIAVAAPSTANLKGTILAASGSGSGGNCLNFQGQAKINDKGYNISDDDSCDFSEPPSGTSENNATGIGLASGPAQNGGPTETIALNGTPANTFIPAADCTDQSGDPLTTDQRGFVRPINGTCSAGAYQFASALPIDCSTAVASNPNLTAVLPVFASEYVFGVSNQARPYNLQITGVTQDKPVPSFPLCPNAFWSSTTTYVRVTNEPLQGPGGLLYEIEFSATDTASGVSCTGAVPVCVQGILNSGKQCLAPLDASYDATKCP
jgi:predicted outer membrane repeat protein